MALKVARRTEKQQQTMSGYVLGAGRSVKEREGEREREKARNRILTDGGADTQCWQLWW